MNSVKCEVKKLIIPTYLEPKAEELSMFAEKRVHQCSSGRPYPNKIVLKVNREEKVNKEYTIVVLENEYLKIEILRLIKLRDMSFFTSRTPLSPHL